MTERLGTDGSIDSIRGIDMGRALRQLRRAADVSQRQLASKSGVPQTTIAHIESGAIENPSLRTIERLAGAVGARLILTFPDRGQLPAASPHEEWRDKAGRRYPAHLDARKLNLPDDWWGAWWASSVVCDRWPLDEVPEVTFDLARHRRDERRVRFAKGNEATVRRLTDVPGLAWLAELGDGTPVGVLCAHVHATELDEGRVYSTATRADPMVIVDRVRVRIDYRCCGIGRRLVDALIGSTDHLVVAGAAGFAPQRFLRSCGFAQSRDVVGAMWFACQGGRVKR